MMSRPPQAEARNTWWIVLVVVLLALAAAAAAWYFLLRDNGDDAGALSRAPRFDWVGAWGRTDGSGGGVVVEQSGQAYQVTVYDSTLQVARHRRRPPPKGKELAFTLESSESVGGAPRARSRSR